MKNSFDICAESFHETLPDTKPSRPGIFPSTAYVCSNPELANAILAGETPGYAYQRDGHPNADILKLKCGRLHDFEANPEIVCTTITSSGMAALTLAIVSQLKAGDHVLLSSRLYGKTATLVEGQFCRFGIKCSSVDICSLERVGNAIQENTRMIIVETISNPQLRIADISGLAELAHTANAMLLVDNTFATPVVCRPLKWGADLVLESISKFMNGHGDLMLGMLCGHESIWPGVDGSGVDSICSTWGLASSPFDCWLAERGLSSLGIRMQQAARTTLAVAEFLETHSNVVATNYPGLSHHPDREIGVRQFSKIENRTCFANLLSFDLRRAESAEAFIRSVEIPFCPSLGEISTTLSHPGSTSHRKLDDPQLAALGISCGTIRLSIGLESSELLIKYLSQALDGLDS